MQNDSQENQAIPYGAANIHKNSIMGKQCVYSWTDMMVDMGIDNIVNNDREPCNERIFNAWIKDSESDILKTLYQENDQRLLQRYNNIRFLDDEDNQTYMISQENFEFKGFTIRNKQYSVVGQPLDWKDGDNLELLIRRNTNDDFMVLIKGVEQDHDLRVKFFHPSSDDDRQATDSGKEENIDYNSPKTPYDGENMIDSSDDEGNNDEVSPDPPTNEVNVNSNYHGEKNDYEVTPNTPTNGGN